jgi:uncharacterized RDD family membrane protein YckC
VVEPPSHEPEEAVSVVEPPASTPSVAEQATPGTGEEELPQAATPPPAPAADEQAYEPEPADEMPLRPTSAADLLRDVEEAAHRDGIDGEKPESEPPDEWTFELSPPAETPDPVERPAHFSERAQAALIDLSLLVGLWAVVIYFASRAARVSIEGLAPSWPFLVGYLALIGLAYAAYFTGTTGQTLGKIIGGLRVVHRSGRRVGAVRASLRAALAVLGIVALCAGIAPMFFDPARRALHDRLLGTRVVR